MEKINTNFVWEPDRGMELKPGRNKGEDKPWEMHQLMMSASPFLEAAGESLAGKSQQGSVPGWLAKTAALGRYRWGTERKEEKGMEKKI